MKIFLLILSSIAVVLSILVIVKIKIIKEKRLESK